MSLSDSVRAEKGRIVDKEDKSKKALSLFHEVLRQTREEEKKEGRSTLTCARHTKERRETRLVRKKMNR